jgi:hypothetical protein
MLSVDETIYLEDLSAIHPTVVQLQEMPTLFCLEIFVQVVIWTAESLLYSMLVYLSEIMVRQSRLE